MTDVATELPPAAWYPDPSEPAVLRWWDGSTWSTHTMAKPDEPAPPKPLPEPMPFLTGIALASDRPELRTSEFALLPQDRAARAEIYARLAGLATEPSAN